MSDHSQCGHLLDDLSLYLDGEASAAICAEIEHHMRDCENCQVMVNTLEKTITLYRQLPQPEMPERLRRRLYKTLDLSELLTDSE
jgi:anti-sigma factor RsiW